METSLIDTHRKVKAELQRRKEIARELARLEIQGTYVTKIADATAAVERLQTELRELDARVRWPEGQPRGAASGSTIGAALSGRIRAGKKTLGRQDSSAMDLADSMLGVLPGLRSVSVACVPLFVRPQGPFVQH